MLLKTWWKVGESNPLRLRLKKRMNKQKINHIVIVKNLSALLQQLPGCHPDTSRPGVCDNQSKCL